jgi:hypothetical protein
MYKKIRSRLLAAISASQEKREYVLESVFWVPLSNCGSKRSTSRLVPELRSEKLDSSEAAATVLRGIRNRAIYGSGVHWLQKYGLGAMATPVSRTRTSASGAFPELAARFRASME